MITLYSHVKLPPNTIAGATVTAMTTRAGVTLTRVTEEGRDDLIIVSKGRTYEIAWSQIKGAIRAPVQPTAKASK